jgi:hypothetical protein
MRTRGEEHMRMRGGSIDGGEAGEMEKKEKRKEKRAQRETAG